MITWLVKSAAVIAAWNISSWFTLVQMAYLKSLFPSKYDWFMDKAEPVAQFCHEFALTCWEFFNMS